MWERETPASSDLSFERRLMLTLPPRPKLRLRCRCIIVYCVCSATTERDIRDAKAMQCMPSVFHGGIQAERRGPKRGREASRRQSRRRQSPKRRVVPSDLLVKQDLTKAEGGRAPPGKYSDLRSSAIEEKCPLIFGWRESFRKHKPYYSESMSKLLQSHPSTNVKLNRRSIGSPVPYAAPVFLLFTLRQ